MKQIPYRWIAISGLLGLLMPLCWFLVEAVSGGSTFEHLMEVVWPPSAWLMSTEALNGSTKDYTIILLSIVANVALYCLVGGGLWLMNRALIDSPE
jgi:hypothetical protein